MSRPVVPMPGYNVTGVPVRVQADTVPVSRQWCAMEPCRNRAEVIFGARPACRECAEKSRAVVESANVPWLGPVREGDEAVRKAVVP